MSETPTYRFPVTVYYEDTDLTGVVYHANYFRFMERARSEILGGEALYRLQMEDGVAFVVYRADIQFKRGAVLGDRLEVRTQPTLSSRFRLSFAQNIYRSTDDTLLTTAHIELVCVKEERPVAIPEWILQHKPSPV
jgi:acyl-CoA thioester hydrolase